MVEQVQQLKDPSIEKKPTTQHVGRTIAELRNKKKKSIRVIADLSALSRTTLDQIERGIKTPSPVTINILCNTLELLAEDSLRETLLLEAANDEIAKARRKHPPSSDYKFTIEKSIELRPNISRFADMFFNIRSQLNLTQEIFGAGIGIKKSEAEKIERALRIPSYLLVANLCDALAIPETNPLRDRLLLSVAYDRIRKAEQKKN